VIGTRRLPRTEIDGYGVPGAQEYRSSRLFLDAAEAGNQVGEAALPDDVSVFLERTWSRRLDRRIDRFDARPGLRVFGAMRLRHRWFHLSSEG
jgi:hypothetical protein